MTVVWEGGAELRRHKRGWGERNGTTSCQTQGTRFIPAFRIVRAAHVSTHTTTTIIIASHHELRASRPRCTPGGECTRRRYCRCSLEWADTKGSAIWRVADWIRATALFVYRPPAIGDNSVIGEKERERERIFLESIADEAKILSDDFSVIFIMQCFNVVGERETKE